MASFRRIVLVLDALCLLAAGPLSAADLFHYVSVAKRAGGVPAQGSQAIVIDDAARRLNAGETLRLPLPGGQTYDVVYERSMRHENGDTTWVGHLRQGGKAFRVMITFGATSTEGRLFTPVGEYSLTTAENQTWLLDHSLAGGKGLLAEADDTLVPPDSVRRVGAPEPTPEAKAAGRTQIDVLVLYSSEFASAKGGDAGAVTRINSLVAFANQAYVDSQVAIELRLVGTQKVDYPDSTPIGTALSDLSGFGTTGTVTRPAAFANVGNWRNAVGADLVSFVRTFNGDTPESDAQKGSCGLAWIGGSSQSPIGQYSESAFSVVDDGRYYTDGTHYKYCLDYTFAHELGHNMGSMHDRGQVKKANNGNLRYGAYSYSFGYGIDGSFGTIMSYIKPSMGLFSNPNINLCNQGPCGMDSGDTVSSANNALSLNNTRTAVANFRAAAVQAANSVIVEFYNTTLNHYFITASDTEKQNIDNGGAGPGWQRTGESFKVGGASPVCRFYGNRNTNPATGQPYGPNSHFYTIDAAECAAVKLDPGWLFESPEVFDLTPVIAPGICPGGTLTVYRAYNNRAAENDSNHRYTKSSTLYSQMIDQGWKADGVVFCTPA